MFCTKCGNRSAEGSTFCEKCGASLTGGSSRQSTNRPVKSSFGKLPLIIGAAAVILIVIIIIASSSGTDYVMFVKTFPPFEAAGISATYNTVINRFITSPTWVARTVSRDLTFVDMRGRTTDVDGSRIDVVLTFRVRPDEVRGDFYFVDPFRLELNGILYTEWAAEEFADSLFYAFDGGFSSLADLYRSLGLTDGIVRFFGSSTWEW